MSKTHYLRTSGGWDFSEGLLGSRDGWGGGLLSTPLGGRAGASKPGAVRSAETGSGGRVGVRRRSEDLLCWAAATGWPKAGVPSWDRGWACGRPDPGMTWRLLVLCLSR